MLWVRSQNKSILIKAHSICLVYENEICCYHFEGTRFFLGKYSTTKKALKVLDMIEKHLLGCLKLNTLENNETKERIAKYYKDKVLSGDFIVFDKNIDYMPITKIFQMPQDEEVVI